ncbi:MAG: sugar ABC transporter substrate-binding protein [Thiotrichales bacterium]
MASFTASGCLSLLKSSNPFTLPSVARLMIWVLLGALGGAGCQRSESYTQIRFWAMGREGELVRQLLPEFERRHPAIRVVVQQLPWSAAHEKLLTAFVGETMPDVFQLGNTWIPEFAALGALAPLDARIADSATLARAELFPGVVATNVIDGVTYGVPWYVDTRLFFYRTDVLAAAGYAEPPRTWAEWLEALRAVKREVGPDRYALLLPFNEWQALVILALQQGSELLRDDARYGAFDSPEFRAAFEFYVQLFREGLAPALGAGQVANLYQDFARGFINVYVSGPWNIAEFASRLPAEQQPHWGTAPLPGGGQDYPGPSLAGGASLVLLGTSPHQDAAWKLIEFLSEPEQQTRFYQLSGDLPASRRAWRDAALDQDRHAAAFWQQLQALRETPKIPEWERIAELIARHSERVVRGSASMDDALAALDRDVDRLLEKRRWLLARKATQ